MNARTETSNIVIEGTAAAPGLAMGPVFRLRSRKAIERPIESPESEQAIFEGAANIAAGSLAALMESATDEEAEGILAFQIAFLEDDEIRVPVTEAIESGVPADAAWIKVMNTLIADYESSDDAYFRGRATDLKDLRDRVNAAIAGEEEQGIPSGVIVVADDLAPSQFLATNWSGGGLVLKRAGTTSHVAILARARGVPMLVGVGLDEAPADAMVMLDAERGTLTINPDAKLRKDFEARRTRSIALAAYAAAFLDREARSADGEHVRVLINVADPDDLKEIASAHVDGIGLVRTEFLFHGRDRLPNEHEQFDVYRKIVDWAREKPVTVRTLDAGGDKPIPGLTHHGESNPFLGVRGVRLSLEHENVLRTQLHAMVRAAAHGNLKIMVPMVSVPEELARVRAMVTEIASQLDLKAPAVGMMIEVPAAAIAVDQFESDFFSIGSNDLLQYLMAVSRDEPKLASLAQPTAAFWRVLSRVCQHGSLVRKEVSLCGDLGSETRWTRQLLKSGLRTLSVAPAALAAVKAEIHRTTIHG